MDGPLSGLRVLDFSRLFPGPYCTLLLSNLGAWVLKVEDVVEGDPLRHYPPLLDGVGALFAFLNRGKLSVSLDLKREEARRIAADIAATCDVVVEGFRPGVTARLGIDFPTLAARNRRLVYCSISGYGQDGPLSTLPGHDLTYAAMTGLLDALSPGEPRVLGVQLVDASAGLLAALQILAALRSADSGPRYLDVSLAEAARALMPGAIVEALAGSTPSLMALLRGSERNDVYRCADGRWLALSPLEEAFWRRLRCCLQDEGLLEPGQESGAERLRDIFATRSCAEWFALLSAADVPCAPVRTVREAEDQSPHEGSVLSGDAAGGVPALGEHTHAVLRELGRSEKEIARLAAAAVIRPHARTSI